MEQAEPSEMAGIQLAVHKRKARHAAPPLISGTQRVGISTAEGDMLVEVFPELAPITASNFMAYVDRKYFDGQSIFRIVTPHNEPARPGPRIAVVQAGWLPTSEFDRQPFPNIPLETTTATGLRHKRGALSMARHAAGQSGPSFSFMMRDEPELDEGGARHPDGKGFSVFGRLLNGWETLERIYARAEEQPWLKRRITIFSATRA